MPRSPDTVTFTGCPEEAFETSEMELEFRDTHPPRKPMLAITRKRVGTIFFMNSSSKISCSYFHGSENNDILFYKESNHFFILIILIYALFKKEILRPGSV
jgi:hypothetical protein